MKKILSIIAINFVIAIVTAQVNHHIEPVGGSFLPIYTQDSLPANNDIFTNQFLGAGYDGSINPIDMPSVFIYSAWWVNGSNFIIRLPKVIAGTVYVEAVGVVDIIIASGSAAGTKIMQTYDAATKRTIARFNMTEGNLFLNFTNVRSAVVRNIKFYYADELIGTGVAAIPKEKPDVFKSSAYQALESQSLINFTNAMQYHLTNDEVRMQKELEYYQSCYKRALANNIQKVLSYENAIHFANKSGNDIIIPIPLFADAEYLMQLAELVKKCLVNPSIKIYLSTTLPKASKPAEVDFYYRWIKERYKSNHFDLNFDSVANPDAINQKLLVISRYSIAQMLLAGEIFKEVMGTGVMMTSIRPLMQVYGTNPQLEINYLKQRSTNPHQYFYGIFQSLVSDSAALVNNSIYKFYAQQAEDLHLRYLISDSITGAIVESKKPIGTTNNPNMRVKLIQADVSGEGIISYVDDTCIIDCKKENIIYVAAKNKLYGELFDKTYEFDYWKLEQGDSLTFVNSIVGGTKEVFSEIIQVKIQEQWIIRPMYKAKQHFSLFLSHATALPLGEGVLKNKYKAHAELQISAQAYLIKNYSNEGYKFDRWEQTDDGSFYVNNGNYFVENPDSSLSYFIMPRMDVSLKAQYKKPLTHRIRILDGKPALSYLKEGERLNIEASDANNGYNFARWKWINDTISNRLTAYVNDIYAPITSIIANRSMAIHAIYDGVSDTSLHNVEIKNATFLNCLHAVRKGNSEMAIFKSNELFDIQALQPSGESEFYEWKAGPIDDLIFLSDSNTPITRIAVPEGSSGKKELKYEAYYLPHKFSINLKIIDGIFDNGRSEIDSKAGDTLLIGALPTIEGAVFSHWEVLNLYTYELLPAYQNTLFNPYEPNTRLIVPGKNIVIKANFKLASKDGNSGGINEGKSFQLDITKGFINGDTKLTSSTFVYGSKVKITAQAAPDSMIFDKWIGDTACIANMYSPVTELTIPDKFVKIQASYRKALFKLSVIGGSGSGWYRAGDTVNFEYNSLCLVNFFSWDRNVNYVNNIFNYKTFLVMPSFNIEVGVKHKTNDTYLQICFFDKSTLNALSNVELKMNGIDYGNITDYCYFSYFIPKTISIEAHSNDLEIMYDLEVEDTYCEPLEIYLYLSKPNNIVQNLGNQKNVRIFPNPASIHAMIQSEAIIHSISIYNNLGILVYQEIDLSIEKFQIPLHEMKSGVYFVQVQTAEGLMMEKLVIEK